MIQRDGPAKVRRSTAAPDTKNRRIVSEVAFIGLPGDTGWLGFRRVVQVERQDHRRRRPAAAALLTDGASDDFDQARLLLEAKRAI